MSGPRLRALPAVSVPTGRWGSRRVRASECEGIIRAESAYDAMLQDPHPLPAFDALVRLRFTLDGRYVDVSAVRRPNAVWRFGRVFLLCPCCQLRRTRLYIPRVKGETYVLGCRECLGLTYASRSLRNYRDVLQRRGIGKYLGLSYRDDALRDADRAYQERAAARYARWAARRPFLAARVSEQEAANGAET